MSDRFKLAATDLTRPCGQDPFEFKTTADLLPLDKVIGQQRALEAIDFGLNMKGQGYHIFVTGYEGTGKSTILRNILTAHAEKQEPPGDLCLVNNFDDPYCPRPLEMPTGSAVFFSRRMDQYIAALTSKLPQALEAQTFQERQDRIKKEFAQTQARLFSEVEAEAAQRSIAIAQSDGKYQPVLVSEGRPVTPEAFQAFEPEQKRAIEADLNLVSQRMAATLKAVRRLAEEMTAAVRQAAEEMAGSLISGEMDILFADFRDRARVQKFLAEVKQDMLDNMALLFSAALPEEAKDGEPEQRHRFLEQRYKVNVLVDRRAQKGAPVIFESSPSFQNLFGTIEKVPVPGGFTTDFTMVQAGALLRANKGYLVLDIEALLRHPGVWEALKQALADKTLHMEDPPLPGFPPAPSLKPKPVPLDVKVILMGGYDMFRTLQGADPKFNKIFKVRADFDHEAPLTPDTLTAYARFIAQSCRAENLCHFTPCAVTAVVEHGSRLAGDKGKLSLAFGKILDLIREADYWARKAGADAVAADHVFRALGEYRFRHNIYEEKVQERYDDASILLDVDGEVVGQVNALAVYQIGEIAFGRPSRITAESYMGKPGIVNVEREAQLSGQTHDKGVMIIAGYLGRMFAQDHPLSVTVSITFEQSYSGIDGDSASSTELYAVLSSLSGIPIRQGIAVTGSVNQKGEIQAIGGVNEKIEGFFDVCLKKGLTSGQGVMIPAANVKNLMLRKDVVDAVERGRFHIYQVRTIEQGIKVLTGVAAGTRDERHCFSKDTVFGAVQNKLRRFHEQSGLIGR